MSRYSESDPYLDPATGVLKNRLGIADESTLGQTEADIVAARSYELSRRPLKGRFDLAHLQAIHRYLFGDLYEWAFAQERCWPDLCLRGSAAIS
jgi:cell filamentation protein